MNKAKFLQKLEYIMLEAIDKHDTNAVRCFMRSLTEHSMRDRDDILRQHSSTAFFTTFFTTFFTAFSFLRNGFLPCGKI